MSASKITTDIETFLHWIHDCISLASLQMSESAFHNDDEEAGGNAENSVPVQVAGNSESTSSSSLIVSLTKNHPELLDEILEKKPKIGKNTFVSDGSVLHITKDTLYLVNEVF